MCVWDWENYILPVFSQLGGAFSMCRKPDKMSINGSGSISSSAAFYSWNIKMNILFEPFHNLAYLVSFLRKFWILDNIRILFESNSILCMQLNLHQMKNMTENCAYEIWCRYDSKCKQETSHLFKMLDGQWKVVMHKWWSQVWLIMHGERKKRTC